MTFRNRVRVLIVDDDADDYVMLRDLLVEVQDSKFTVDWASSYETGKAELAKKAHDVCFFDFRLGGRTGLDLLKESIAEGCKIPIILLTGYGEHEVDLEAMQLGAADYLIKDQISPFLIERSIRYSIYRAQTIEALMDASFEGLVIHDQQGIILEVNRAAAVIFGYEPQEMIGSQLLNYCDERNRRATGDLIGIKKDGSHVNLEMSSKPFQHRGRRVRLTALRDVTARKRMEAQILMQDRLASVGLLASSLAHEIGTLLGVSRGRAEYLAIQVQDNPTIKKNVDVIVAQIDRVSKLIRSLLNLARGDQIRGAGEVLLNQVVLDVIDLMGHELRRHSIEIRNDISQDVPVHISADTEPLHQVLLNLLVNSVHAIESAIKAGRKSGHSVRLSVKDMGSQWALCVQDSGCGISQENLRHLFKPFFTTKEIGVGTGLGLATSYRIIESWGGSVQVESTEGVGTEFRVLLPKARPA